MAIEREAADLDHIEFRREPTREPELRRRQGFGQAPPRPANRAAHGQTMATETGNAEAQIAESRQAVGIDPSRLLVLEFNSITLDLHDGLEERFAAVVVDEQRRKCDEVSVSEISAE